MKITKELLEAKKACKSGFDMFNEMYPDGFDVSEWTKEKQVETIKTPMRKYLAWAYYSGLIPYWSMSGSDLRGSNLRGSDLRGSDLRGSNLRGSNLRGSDLRGSDLSGSDLRDSDLRGSDLRGSDLSDSDLRGSDLRGGFFYSQYTVFPIGFDPKAAGGWLVE